MLATRLCPDWSTLHALLDGLRLVRRASGAAARQLAALLVALRDGTPSERRSALDADVRRRFSRDVSDARLDAVRAARRASGITGALLARTRFGIGPVSTHLYGLVAIAAPFGLVLLAVHLVHLIGVSRTHRALAPEARGDRWIELVKLLLSPPMAIRAADALSWHRLAGFDAIAVASVMASVDDFAAGVGPVRRDLTDPIDVPALDAPAPAIAQAERRRSLRAVDGLLAERGITVPTRPGAVPADGGFCPRCLEIYRWGEGECGDCPGVALRPG